MSAEMMVIEMLAACDVVWRVGATTFSGESERTDCSLRVFGVVPSDGEFGHAVAEMWRDGDLYATHHTGASCGPGDDISFEVTASTP